MIASAFVSSPKLVTSWYEDVPTKDVEDELEAEDDDDGEKSGDSESTASALRVSCLDIAAYQIIKEIEGTILTTSMSTFQMCEHKKERQYDKAKSVEQDLEALRYNEWSEELCSVEKFSIAGAVPVDVNAMQ